MHHFFVAKSGFEGDSVRLGAEQAHQVCHVLRLRAGDAIVVLDGAGSEFDVTLTSIGREVLGRIVGTRQATGEPGVQVALFQGLLAREKFEWVLQKGTEVGVARFVPVQTERTLLRARHIDDRKLIRWQRIVAEAAEQSHRGRVPQIEEAITWPQALSQLGGFDRALIASTSGETLALNDALRPDGKTPGSIALLIGPEGGFSDAETAQARDSGAVAVTLGPRILRTETAAIVAPALVLHILGQTQS
ncbi:16S rRNA (uracil(1498)-N(3))-methyltransferase [Anaerobaca lacustris]|uniref:Ribosomal RNA small subunit methyltransferase E n=1 Tax=Anaerobaca lacustris TaxID=3044600 RepID=A0AAW6TZQ2_9BACT|nr:16S rRNA (uracil(1498)-N(3))-methyltransferase [Sedimentisphaerales bacterium M17dextr]